MVEKWLSDTGFSGITTEEIKQKTWESATALLESAKTKNTSVLTLISQEAFEKGIDDLAEYIRNNPDDPWLFHDKLAFTVGVKTGNSI